MRSCRSLMRVRSTVSAVSGLTSSCGTATSNRPLRASLTGSGAGSISILPSRQRTSIDIPGLSPASCLISLGMTSRPAASMVVFMVKILPYNFPSLNNVLNPLVGDYRTVFELLEESRQFIFLLLCPLHIWLFQFDNQSTSIGSSHVLRCVCLCLLPYRLARFPLTNFTCVIRE